MFPTMYVCIAFTKSTMIFKALSFPVLILRPALNWFLNPAKISRQSLIVISAAHKVAAFFANQLAVVLHEALAANGAVEHRVVVGPFRLLGEVFGLFGVFHCIAHRPSDLFSTRASARKGLVKRQDLVL